MKVFSNLLKVAAVVAILTPTLPINTASAQQSYPLSCRGGGTLSIRNDGNNGVKIGFQAGPGAAPKAYLLVSVLGQTVHSVLVNQQLFVIAVPVQLNMSVC